jgi:hypothetical protein
MFGTEAVMQERVAWAADERHVAGARDVVEVLEWATEEACVRRSVFALFALIVRGERDGLVWLGGWDPTSSHGNFERPCRRMSIQRGGPPQRCTDDRQAVPDEARVRCASARECHLTAYRAA